VFLYGFRYVLIVLEKMSGGNYCYNDQVLNLVFGMSDQIVANERNIYHGFGRHQAAFHYSAALYNAWKELCEMKLTHPLGNSNILSPSEDVCIR